MPEPPKGCAEQRLGSQVLPYERFTSRILPPYMRWSPQVAEVMPLLYVRGLSTGDFREALLGRTRRAGVRRRSRD